MFEFIKSLFAFKKSMSQEEIYYANSTDLVDLERRMRKVQNGSAPFQENTILW